MTPPLAVLLAEDDEGHATLVRRNLRRAGIEGEPIHLRDGQDLLDYVRQRGRWSARPLHEGLVVLLDLKMPRLGGMEVLQQLKGDPALAKIPVFVLTTTDNVVEIDRCYALGAAACIVKPVDFGAFGESIQRLGRFLQAVRLPGDSLPLDAPAHG
ncbi:MAG TPA: response regulator [Vicinamibacterales bacterium]|nr:response regulator [Vicinamibacterales bacterium]